MYDNWKIKKWETPVSDWKWLFMDSLTDSAKTHTLEILLSDKDDYPQIAIQFKNYPIYRNIVEEYRTTLWNHLSKTSQWCGWTFEVVNSPWLEKLCKIEPLIEVHDSGLRHFVISTNDDVIEVLSNLEPNIEKVV